MARQASVAQISTAGDQNISIFLEYADLAKYKKHFSWIRCGEI
jgi:hypothetical protein